MVHDLESDFFMASRGLQGEQLLVPPCLFDFRPSNLNSSLVLPLMIVPRQQLLATLVDGASSAYCCYWSQCGHQQQQQSTMKKRMRASTLVVHFVGVVVGSANQWQEY